MTLWRKCCIYTKFFSVQNLYSNRHKTYARRRRVSLFSTFLGFFAKQRDDLSILLLLCTTLLVGLSKKLVCNDKKSCDVTFFDFFACADGSLVLLLMPCKFELRTLEIQHLCSMIMSHSCSCHIHVILKTFF